MRKRYILVSRKSFEGNTLLMKTKKQGVVQTVFHWVKNNCSWHKCSLKHMNREKESHNIKHALKPSAVRLRHRNVILVITLVRYEKRNCFNILLRITEPRQHKIGKSLPVLMCQNFVCGLSTQGVTNMKAWVHPDSYRWFRIFWWNDREIIAWVYTKKLFKYLRLLRYCAW